MRCPLFIIPLLHHQNTPSSSLGNLMNHDSPAFNSTLDLLVILLGFPFIIL